MTKYKYFGQLCKLADEAHILYRNEKNRWLTVWTEEDLKWCIDMGFMYEDKPLYHLGENEFHQYFSLTDEDRKIVQDKLVDADYKQFYEFMDSYSFVNKDEVYMAVCEYYEFVMNRPISM